MKITSPVFKEGKPIPPKYTCDGADISPPLAWSEIPAGTQSLALISDDPDAPRGTWVHWVLYNLPAHLFGLPENIPNDKTLALANGGAQGKNDFQKIGYGGPCPPKGTHRYYFKLYALDSSLALPSGATQRQVLEAMKGHVLAEAELMGTYAR